MVELERVFKGHDDRVWSLDFTPDAQLIASCSSDKTIKLWSVSDGVCQTTLDGTHSRTVRQVTWCPTSQQGKLCLASASFDATAVVWQQDGPDFEPVSPLEGHENEVKSVAFNHDGTLIATCSRDKTIWVWERDEDEDFSCQAVLSGHSQDVKFVKWHPTENLLYSASYDDSVKCWRHEQSIDDWMCSATLNGHKSTVWQLDFSPSGEYLVSCSQDKTLRVWTTKDNKEVAVKQDAHERAILSVSWSSQGLIATGGADNQLKLFKVSHSAEGQMGLDMVAEVEAHDGDVNCVQF